MRRRFISSGSHFPSASTVKGVPSTMRSIALDLSFSHDTAKCIRPTVRTPIIAAVKERSSPRIAVVVIPPMRNSTTMSKGACWLAARRPMRRMARRTTR